MTSSPLPSKAETNLLYVFCILTSIIPILGINIPRSYAFAPIITGAICFAAYYVIRREKPQISVKTALFVLITLALSAASLLWAKHFDISKAKVIKLLALLPPQILLISLAASLNKDQLKPLAKYLPIGFIIAAALLLFEITTKGTLHNIVRGEAISTVTDPDDFNRGSTSLSLYAFMVFALLSMHIKKLYAAFIAFIPLGLAIFMSESQSAQLCLIIGALFLFAFPYQSKIAHKALKFSIITLMLAAPFFITHVYANFAQSFQDVPVLARAYAGHRLEIWDYVSRYALQEPLHGYGIEMTRETLDFDSKRKFYNDNSVLHPHNFAIQIWVEFGLIGILIAAGLIYSLFTTIEKKFTIAQQKVILPTLMATLVPAAFAYGLWQGQWIGLMFHVTAATLMVATLINKDKTLDI